ncbi:MAG: class I SAM-dependent methyltransferase [Planctomycetota bacterium]
MDRYQLYELCVTDPPRLTRFLAAVHGGTRKSPRPPLTLREDFCGSGAVARYWATAGPKRRAIAVDNDARVLKKAKGPGVRTIASDAARCKAKADIISATNFPIGYWHTREELVAYLRTAKSSLNPRGIFVCDMYGGRSAFTSPTATRRTFRASTGERVEYTWRQVEADPISGLVTDTLSFRVTRKGQARAEIHRDAFVYHWRLWSIPELTDVMHEAGFAKVEVYDRLGDAIDGDGRLYVRPVGPGEGLDEDWVVYIAARK